MKTTICLIRHGQTEWNNMHLIQGRLNNPLNETGHQQAIETGKMLKENDPNWDVMISSPLTRAIESANEIKQIIGYKEELIIDERVIEREFGEAEGHQIEKEIYDLIEIDQVDGMETRAELQKRSYNAVIDIARKYPNKKVLIVTHSHFIKGLLTKISDNVNFYSTVVNNAGANYFYIENDQIIGYETNKTFK